MQQPPGACMAESRQEVTDSLQVQTPWEDWFQFQLHQARSMTSDISWLVPTPPVVAGTQVQRWCLTVTLFVCVPPESLHFAWE